MNLTILYIFLPSSTASFYDVRYSTNEDNISDETLWNGLPAIAPSDLTSGSLTPIPAGQAVNFEVSKVLFDTTKDFYYLAMRAADSLNQTSPISNTLKLIVDIYPPNQVGDLAVNLREDMVTINFTAPGEDSNEGTGN